MSDLFIDSNTNTSNNSNTSNTSTTLVFSNDQNLSYNQIKNKNFINFNSSNFYQISNNDNFAWSSFKFNLFPLIK